MGVTCAISRVVRGPKAFVCALRQNITRISPGYQKMLPKRRDPPAEAALGSAAFGRSRDSATDSPTDGAPPLKNGRPFRKGAAARDGGALRRNAAARAGAPLAHVGRTLGPHCDSLFQCTSARQDIARHRI